MPTDAAVVLRPRNDWEAADLGVELARAWVGPLARVWTVAYLGPALLLVAASPWPGMTALLAWWVRPVAERAVLEVLARRTFGRRQSMAAALATMPQLLRTPGPLVASLAWRRLSPIRTLWLAVWHLEGLRGPAARARIGVLTRDGRGVASWCASIGLLASGLMALSLLALVLALLPDAMGATLSAWVNGDTSLPLREARVWAALVILADGLCAPWIIAAVFGLYISRRTDLEAWDLEQVFRGMARRLAMVSLVCLLLWLASTPVAAQSRSSSPPPPRESRAAPTTPPQGTNFEPRQAIRRILADPAFGRPQTVQQWRVRQGPRRAPATPPAWMTWLLQHVPRVAATLRWGMWVVAIGVIGWLALAIWRGRRRPAPSPDDDVLSVVADDARPADVPPPDVARRARAAIASGAVVDALGLLYAGALHACVERGTLDLQPGDTEADCLRRLRGRLPGDTERTLREVIGAWQAAAYARRVPTPERALAMCDAYLEHFDGGAA